MKITRFEAENFKRLKAVDITPEGNAVVIGGRNAQGKTSVLDGIMAALAGKKGSKELVRPIRDGETQASVVVELDDLVVTRRWKATGSDVTVSPKGSKSKLSSPQAILDKLIGALAFDPLEFAESEPKKQVETLIDLIGREAFDALAAERKAAYDNRTEMNREAKSLRARRDALGPQKPAERVDVAALVDEVGVARRRYDLRREWEHLEARMAEIRIQVSQLPEARPLEALTALLADAESINKAADAYEQSRELDDQLASAEGASAAHTELIDSVDKQRAALIANADLPVAGLTFDDEGISYNGVPFQQSSAAERLKVSVAMAMAMNPELRVICIRDASLLDDESKAALIDMATEHDYQIWLEVVGDAGELGVVIEDGQVQA